MFSHSSPDPGNVFFFFFLKRCVFHYQRNVIRDPHTYRPRASIALERWTLKFLLVSESFPTMNLGPRVLLEHKYHAVENCPSVTSRLGCKCKKRGCHCFHQSFTTKTCRQSGLKTKHTGEEGGKKKPKRSKTVKSLLKLTLESLTGRSLECSSRGLELAFFVVIYVEWFKTEVNRLEKRAGGRGRWCACPGASSSLLLHILSDLDRDCSSNGTRL